MTAEGSAVLQQGLDLLDGIDDGADTHFVVDGGHEVGAVLGAVHIEVPAALQQLGLAVGQVGAQDGGQNALLHSLVELLQAAGEQGEGGVGDDVLGAALLQLTGNFQHALAGSDDVVSDEDGLAFHAFTQVLVGNDGVAAIDHTGVVTALVEHTQVAAQDTGEVHVAVDGAFVGADDHEVVGMEAQLGHVGQQGLENLIGGHDVVEAHQGHGVHQAGIVGIKGDDVLHAHALELLEGHGAVQALTNHAAVLTAAIQGGHDDGHPMAAAGYGLDQALQVGEMIVGGHVVLHTEQVVGQAVIAGIHHEEDIIAADGFLDQALCIAALEPGAGAVDDEGLLLDADFLGPGFQMLVDLAGQCFRTGAGDQSDVSNLGLGVEKCGGCDNVIGHFRSPLKILLMYRTWGHKCAW